MYWYEDEVRALERKCIIDGYEGQVVCYGSSTIRLWQGLEHVFKEHPAINLGFGGSTLAACVWFFDRLMVRFSPKALVIYAGDNDLGDGRHPEEVLLFFRQLVASSWQRFGKLPCFFVSLKPSPARWHMAEQFRYTNNLIQSEIIKLDSNWQFINVFPAMLAKDGKPIGDFYEQDGLHLSTAGYLLWEQLISAAVLPFLDSDD